MTLEHSGLVVRPGGVDEHTFRAVYVGNEYQVPDSMTGMTVVDVGAHVGYFAVLCLERGAKHVVCVEPDEENHAVLRKNLEKYADRVTLHCAAVRHQDGPALVRLERHPSISTCHSIVSDRGEEVDGISLDSVLDPFEKVDVLKIDCEGAEYEILYSSKQLSKCERIVGEAHVRPELAGDSYDGNKCDPASLLEFLRKRYPGLHSFEQPRSHGHQYAFHAWPGRGKVKVMFGRFPYPNNEEHTDVVDWLLRTQGSVVEDDRISEHYYAKLCDTPITMCRNVMLKKALEVGADALVMVDNDMKPDCEGGAPPWWDTAFDHWWNYPGSCNVAAPYCGPPPRELVYVFQWVARQNDPEDFEFRMEKFGREEAARMTGITEVAALPTGLILMDVEGTRRIPDPYFYYEFPTAEALTKASTEDVSHTRDSSTLGIRQFCTWDSWAGHWKRKCVTKPRPLMTSEVPFQFRKKLLSEFRRGNFVTAHTPETKLLAV